MSPDALHAAVGHLCREWGDYGYRVLELRSIGWRGAGAIKVRCSDGSMFWIACDQYGGHLDARYGHAEPVYDAVPLPN